MLLTIQSIIEELREQAEDVMFEYPDNDPDDMTENEAADLIEELHEVLKKIAAGAPNAAELAREAINPIARMKRGLDKVPRPPRPKKPFDPLL